MKNLVIRWEKLSEETGQVIYFANELNIGAGDSGFDQIIKTIKENPGLEKIILKAPLTLGLGGESMESTFPFASRYDELKNVTGTRNLIIDYL
jgi:hypothetical protein